MAEVMTQFRLLARDLGRATYENLWLDNQESSLLSRAEIKQASSPSNGIYYGEGAEPILQQTSDVAKLDPSSVVSIASLQTLKEASGIQVPKIATVIQLLLGYLALLVPVN